MSFRTEDSLRTLLLSLGYGVEAPATLVGKSGVAHDFDLCATLGRARVVVEVEDRGRPAEISILALYAKSLDTGIDRSVLITAAPITDMVGRLAELYNTRIIHPGTPAEELRRQLSDFLSADPKPSPRLIS